MGVPQTKFVHVQFLGPRLLQGTLERRIESVMQGLGATVLQRSPRWLGKDEDRYDEDLHRWVQISYVPDEEDDLLGRLYEGFDSGNLQTLHVEVADSADHQMTFDDDDSP